MKIDIVMQGVELLSNRSAGLKVNQRSLIIYNITRHLSGALTCQAENAVGRGSSEELQVNVKCEFWLTTVLV